MCFDFREISLQSSCPLKTEAMADGGNDVPVEPIADEEPEETPGYKAPAQKSLAEIQQLDAEDESLVKYKQILLAGVESACKNDDYVQIQLPSFIYSIFSPLFEYLTRNLCTSTWIMR